MGASMRRTISGKKNVCSNKLAFHPNLMQIVSLQLLISFSCFDFSLLKLIRPVRKIHRGDLLEQNMDC